MRGSTRDFVAGELAELAELVTVVARELAGEIAAIADLTVGVVTDGGRLLFCGNGGSAADAQHLATEYVVRFQRERRPVAALALTTDTSLLTAAGNDYGFEHVFARQVQALGRAGDILFLHSTSGRSRNLLRATEAARELGVTTVGILAGDGGDLVARVDHAVVVPTRDTARAQELQLVVGHIICKFVEERLDADD